MNRAFIIGLVLIIAFSFLGFDADAQCAMCKASAETSLEEGSTKAGGINNAIIYLMSFPYLLGGVFVFMWFRNNKKKQREEVLA